VRSCIEHVERAGSSAHTLVQKAGHPAAAAHYCSGDADSVQSDFENSSESAQFHELLVLCYQF
jgi:hypothetical protein